LAHEQNPPSKEREVGRAKDFSATPRTGTVYAYCNALLISTRPSWS